MTKVALASPEGNEQQRRRPFPLRTFSFKLGEETVVVNPVVTTLVFVLAWGLVALTKRKSDRGQYERAECVVLNM
jgi:hypothetical protein